MPKNVIMYDLLISCPSDVIEELNIIDSVVEQFNQQFQDTLNIGIRTRHWSKSSYVQSGDKPQELLNKQFVNDCDAAIAIFGTRFGTPTDKYGSGSEEEIEIMLKKGRQVFMYFSDTQKSPSEIDIEQLQKVKEFKQKYIDRGIYHTYSTLEEFRIKLNAHITQYFLSRQKVEELQKSVQPDLILCSIRDDKLSQKAIVQKFDMNSFPTIEDRKEKIIQTYKNILDIPVSGKYQSPFLEGLAMNFNKPVEIPMQTKKIIKMIADALEINIPDSFFELGGLSENTLSPSRPFGRTFDGTDEEKKKYRQIMYLEELINDLYAWTKISSCYEGLTCLKFVLANVGSVFDEDVDLTIKFPINTIKSHKTLTYPGDGCFEQLVDGDCTLESIFGIPATETYDTYDSSCYHSPVFVPNRLHMSDMPFENRDYYKEYMDDLDSIFSYQVFQKDQLIIIKLHIDYIKQHSKIAFPTPILVEDLKSGTQLHYSIVSKNNSEVVEKSITVESE